jgi:hypothetical protein
MTVKGSSIISISASDNVGILRVTIMIDNVLKHVDLQAPYEYAWDTNYYSNSQHVISAGAFDNAGNSATATHIVIVSNKGSSTVLSEKIGVFFWASDAATQAVIDQYIGILQTRGYTSFFDFKNTENFEVDFNKVEAYEDVDDIVFFYLFAHGNSDETDSYAAFCPKTKPYTYSSQFRTMMDRLETPYKGFLIESCHSGGWFEDFQSVPYLAMTTADNVSIAYSYSGLPGEGKFSHYFWESISSGYNAIEAFSYASTFVTDPAQNPQIANYASYIFFS